MKLGSSCGELNGTPSFAEVFGAYGWSEDLAMMKWHTDLAVVRGINRLLPHAFTLKEFPDPDCPPHFYARGNNPQWKYFPSWLKYAQTLCELHSDGKAVIPAAVLYHAETEWQKSDCIKCETIIAILCRHQIDSRIVSFDHLKDATVENGTLTIKDADIKLLFAADRELLPDSEKETLDRLSKEGLDIVYVDENNLADLAEIAAARKLQGLEVDTYSPSLVYRHYRKNGSESYFLVNESWQTPVCTKLNTPLDGNWQQIDLISGKRCKFTGNIELAPGESALLIPDDGTTVPAKAVCRGRKTRLKLPTAVPEKDFYGTISTSVQITAEKSDMRIEFPELRSGAVVEISIDGKTGGHCFAPPFRFDLADLSIGKTLDVQFSFTTTPAPAFRNERFDLDAPFPDDFWDIYVEIS